MSRTLFSAMHTPCELAHADLTFSLSNSATKNPRVSEDAKNRAQEKLGQLSNAIAEQSQQEQPSE